VPRIRDFCSRIYVFGCKLSLVRLCDNSFGITPVDDITNGITCFCFHIAHISFASSWYLFCLSGIVLARLCVFGTVMSIKKAFFYYYYYYYYYYVVRKSLTEERMGCLFLYFVDLHPNITNLMHKFFILLHLLYSSTCFEQYYAHLQDDNCISTPSCIVTLFR